MSTNRVVEELKKRIINNNFKAISIEMKYNKDKITIIPCGYDIKSFSDIEYFLVESRLPWGGNDSIDKVASFICNYKNEIDKNKKERRELKKFYENHKNNDRNSWYDYYSDWYKDVYGCRPK